MPRVNFDDLEYNYDGLVMHDGIPFSGEAFELHPDGKISFEGSYDFGRLSGVSHEYYPSGTLKSEFLFRSGVRHGAGKEWYPDGKIRAETLYESGILLKRLEAGDDGQLRTTFELREDHPNYAVLLAGRR